MAIASLCQHFIQSIILALLIGFYPINIRAADEQIVITTLPKEFSDSWIVKSVRVNVQQGRHRNIEFNDTALIGRRFKFSEKEISYNTQGASLCVNPKAGKLVRGLNKLLELTMGWNGFEAPGEPATVADFWLPLKGDTLVESFTLTCSQGLIGPGSSPRMPPPLNATEFDTWVVLLNSDEMAMRWYDDTILLLRREVKRTSRH